MKQIQNEFNLPFDTSFMWNDHDCRFEEITNPLNLNNYLIKSSIKDALRVDVIEIDVTPESKGNMKDDD